MLRVVLPHRPSFNIEKKMVPQNNFKAVNEEALGTNLME